jgi:AAA-like domain
MDIVTPAVWAFTVLMTKAIEKGGGNLGDKGSKLLDKVIQGISTHLSSESAHILEAQPEQLWQDLAGLAEIEAVVENNPEVATDIQSLSVQVNRDQQWVFAMEAFLQRESYDVNIRPIVNQVTKQLERLKWELDHPPSSHAFGQEKNILRYPDGAEPLGSIFYIEPEEVYNLCKQAIAQPSSLLRIQAPRQAGKTSLLERLVIYAKDLNYRVIRVDLRHVDREDSQNLERLLKWLCRQICRQSGLSINVQETWDHRSGSIAISARMKSFAPAEWMFRR